MALVDRLPNETGAGLESPFLSAAAFSPPAPVLRLPHDGPTSATSAALLLTVDGQHQGRIRGDASDGRIVGRSLSWAVRVPRDASTGQTTGRRQYEGLVFTHASASASVQLFAALVTNEVLGHVHIEVAATHPDGKRIVAQTIELAPATVTSLSHVRTADSAVTLQQVSLSFAKITVTDLVSGKTAVDDWRT